MRTCPRCEESLVVIDVGQKEAFYLDQCPKCFGLFFDNGELEMMLEKYVLQPSFVDQDRITTLIEERRSDPWPVAYLKCPACSTLMNRKSYGARSGVVVDWCKQDGIWIDGGELRALLLWAKAGGVQHSHVRSEQKQRRLLIAQQRKEQELRKLRFKREPLGILSHFL